METRTYPFKPIPLPYAFNALEPYIGEETLRIHYEKLYMGYITRLNNALRAYPNFWDISLECLLKNPSQIPCDVRTEVMRGSGGVFNHELYFLGMSGCKKDMSDFFRKKLDGCFCSAEKWADSIFQCAASVFGSGYAALCADRSGRLKNITFSNQDTDYLKEYTPILLVDVWEHSYFLQYRSDRASYIKNWLKLIDWDTAEQRLAKSCK